MGFDLKAKSIPPSSRWIRCVHAFATATLAALGLAAHAAQTEPDKEPAGLASRFKIDAWQSEQGLPMNTVQSLAQVRSGALWVGTASGVARFDGLRFTTFESASVREVASRAIFGFMEDRQGVLWIGHSRGAVRYQNGVFEKGFDEQIAGNRRVWSFVQTRDGVIWAASENGLLRWDKGQVSRLSTSDGLPTNRLRALALDRDETLWIGTTGGGLVSYKSGHFKTFNPTNGFPHLEVRDVLADPSGGVWAATAGAGLVWVGEDAITSRTSKNGLPTDQLTSLALDQNGALWIGTWGAGVVQLRNGRFTTISSGSGLAGDQVWCVSVDQENSVWVGTWNGGLNRISQRTFGVLGKPEGIANDNVRAVIHARDGSSWLSTAGGGVHRIVGERIERIGKNEGLTTDETSALLETRDGTIWIGTYTSGITRLRKGVAPEHFSIADGLPNVDVRTIFEDRDGVIWVGTHSGLARWNGKRFDAVLDEGMPREGVNTVLQDRNGALWFGTAGKGLVQLQNGRFQTFTRKQGLVSEWVLALHEDKQGALWVGTNGEGMNRFKNNEWTAIRPADGLWDGVVQVILEDRSGNLWMTSNRGFFRVSLENANAFADRAASKITSVGFGAGYALRSTTFAGGLQPAGAIDAQGRLWLPSLKGVVIVDPNRLPDSQPPPVALIEEVSIDGKRHALQEPVVLPPGSKPISIRYGAATLLNAERTRFRYLLEGHGNWIDAGRNREATFPALPHGAYKFRVATSVDGQQWKEAAAPIDITVQPRFVETKGFIALVALAGIGLVGGLLQFRTHQLSASHAEMELMVAKKTEELRLANEYLSQLSLADPLTGLANRRHLDKTLSAEWRRAQRMQTSLALVLIDIDFFKNYNDTLGHLAGDKCLVAVADVINLVSNRAGDFAARFGGEEFCVLIPGADHAAALEHAEIMRRACEQQQIAHPASSIGSVVTISVGVAAAIPSNADTSQQLLEQADAALYRAKAGGRNRVM